MDDCLSDDEGEDSDSDEDEPNLPPGDEQDDQADNGEFEDVTDAALNDDAVVLQLSRDIQGQLKLSSADYDAARSTLSKVSSISLQRDHDCSSLNDIGTTTQ